MVGFLMAFIAVILVGAGGRDQLLVAGLAARQGQRPALLIIGLVCAALAALGAIWLASSFAPKLELPVRRMMAVLALGLAALEMIVMRPKPGAAEPTESLGAFSAVLLAMQITDAARFLIFGIIMASALPGAAGLGGALGGMAVVFIGWAAGAKMHDLPLAKIRRALGIALLVLAAGLVVFLRQSA